MEHLLQDGRVEPAAAPRQRRAGRVWLPAWGGGAGNRGQEGLRLPGRGQERSRKKTKDSVGAGFERISCGIIRNLYLVSALGS